MDELRALREQLQKGFYERLINGEIKEAKAALEFSFRTFRKINTIISAVIKKLEENFANKLTVLWQTFKTSFYAFQALAEKELDITGQTFKEDPEVWKELLSSTFKKKVEELSSLLDSMHNLLEVSVSAEEPLPVFEYSPKYLKQKERDKLYSWQASKINDVEYKIRFNLSKGITNKKGITQKIKTGDWAGFYHAYLPEPMGEHRIVYSWNSKIVRFEIIGTHKELGIY